MAGGRILHGSLAAAAAVLAAAAGTVDLPEKLHLKATPILFYAMPISMPLPPLASLGHVDSQPLSLSLPRVSRDSSSTTYASSPFSLAQGAPATSLSASSRRAISHLFPVYLATSVAAPQVAASSQLFPVVTPPALAPFSFSSSALYAAPVTKKHITGYCAYSSYLAQAQAENYVESLLGSLSYVESAVVKAPSQGLQSLHTWHGPTGKSQYSKDAPMTVVLLGWLGAQQKHLKKYADWYNARGIHAVTFVIPMADILSFQVEKNAEEHVESLARQLAQWLHEQGEEKGDKQLMFHIFSNTGWLTYGVVLEKMQEQGEDVVRKIKGCVIDSAPFPNPDPQVWASGFSAALLKKRSSATKLALSLDEVKEGVTVEAASQGAVGIGGANGLENAVQSVLEKFFSIFLKMPAIKQRLSEVVTVLQKKQPPCPQLYIYSTADKVIPVKAVEAFIEEQRLTGRVVRSCNLQNSPHVDHFRSHPHLYSEQLSDFLKEVVVPSPHAQADAL